MSCDNVITVQDLETDKKHSTFYREVITGKAGGTGADIDSATNAVTGQTQATLPKVLSNVGFSPAGFDFTTGGTLTERDKAIFYQADGNWYSWGGTLPKVVPPASSPASTGGIADNAWNVSTSAFMYRDWEGFTAALLAQAGIVDDGQPDTVGNSQRVDAIRIVSGVSSGAAMHYLPRDIGIANLSKSFLKEQVVLTGDSLSFNGFGYPVDWSVVGSGYAADQPMGISPWSALLRDSMISSNFFEHADVSKMSSTTALRVPTPSERKNHGMNYNAVIFTPASPADLVKIATTYSGTKSLLVGSKPVGTSSSITVNGVVTTLDGDGKNRGYAYKLIPFAGDECVITAATHSVSIYGVAPENIVLPVITGKGGYTSTQILGEYDDLIGCYNPGVIFIIAGANDAALGNPTASGFVASMTEIVARSRLANPNVEICIISMPPTSSYNPSVILEYVNAGYKIARDNDCHHIDLYTEMLRYAPASWRFDNVHCNIYGDTIWFNIIKKLMFPQLEVGSGFIPVREFTKNAFSSSLRNIYKGFNATVSMGVTPSLFYISDSFYSELIKLEYTTLSATPVLKVTLPAGFSVSSVDQIFSAPSQTKMARLFQSSGNAVYIILTGIGDLTPQNPASSGAYAHISVTRV